MRIDKHEFEVWHKKRPVVVAPVPHNDIDLVLDFPENPLVIHSRIDRPTLRKMGFVLLPLFDAAGRRVQVLQSSKPLYRLSLKIAVGHRMSHRGNP